MINTFNTANWEEFFLVLADMEMGLTSAEATMTKWAIRKTKKHFTTEDTEVTEKSFFIVNYAVGTANKAKLCALCGDMFLVFDCRNN